MVERLSQSISRGATLSFVRSQQSKVSRADTKTRTIWESLASIAGAAISGIYGNRSSSYGSTAKNYKVKPQQNNRYLSGLSPTGSGHGALLNISKTAHSNSRGLNRNRAPTGRHIAKTGKPIYQTPVRSVSHRPGISRSYQINRKKAQIATIRHISKPSPGQKKGYVAFYKSGPSGFLSNFAKTPLTYKNRPFQCSEAAFQWRKVTLAAENIRDPRIKKAILKEAEKFHTASGEQAYDLQKKIFEKFKGDGLSVHPSWDQGERIDAMQEILTNKFTQNPHLADLLLATGSSYLLEHRQKHASDTFWSDGHDGTGQNVLGKLLMKTRRSLREQRFGPGPAPTYHSTRYYAAQANKRHPALAIHGKQTYRLPH